MAHYAYLDLCFFERCNLTCAYCRETNDGMMGEVSLGTFREVVQSFLRHSSAAVFKVSGYGEASLWPHLVEALAGFAGRFPVTQVITNGTMAPSRLDALMQIRDLVFCVTVDGHLPAANVHRTGGNARLHERMLSFVRRVLAAGHPVELNCVLTAANVDAFASYAEYIRRELPGAVVMPFPVRPFVGLPSSPAPASAEQIARLREEVLGRFGDLSPALPPRPYLDRLFAFMERRQRAWPCLVPVFNYGIGPRLSPLACACLGHTKPSDDLFNLVVPESVRSSDDRIVDVSHLRPERLSRGSVDERCATCFTHYEVLNLFFAGAVSLDELSRIPSFRSAPARDALRRLAEEIAAMRSVEPRPEVRP